MDTHFPSTGTHHRRRAIIDASLIALMALAAEAGHFVVRHGRAVTCADSMQYLDNALAILDPDVSADFAFRKPGYSFLMALCLAVSGGAGWAVVAVNHLLAATLAPLAYALGLRLSGMRGVGWIAGLLALARLQTFLWSDRILAEPLFAVLVTAALLATAGVAGSSPSRRCASMGGVALAAAWLVRASATAVIPATLVWMAWRCRKNGVRRLAVTCGCFFAPVMGAWLLECSLNLAGTGDFRPCTGTLGPMLVMRACSLQGAPLSAGASQQECLSLLPERAADEAYRVNKLDAWVARARAVRDRGLSEWETDALMRQAGWDTLMDHAPAYARTTAELTALQLWRGGDQWLSDAFIREDALPVISTSTEASPSREPPAWFVGCALPHRSEARATEVARMLQDFETRKAGFSGSQPWNTLRYAVMHRVAKACFAAAAALGRIPPLLSLLLCFWLCRDRGLCALLALVYVVDALLAAATLTSLDVVPRMQDVWLGADSALAATALGLSLVELRRTAESLALLRMRQLRMRQPMDAIGHGSSHA
ncbi:MAG: hypothetical protein IT449_17175 [Phycisphaerales bacterium]|nr:hypothetical protein [Phycisphaerales bacterium]